MLLCIGGVCVPYTAVVPILILAFKWVASKLAQMGLLPKFLQDILQLSTAVSTTINKDAPQIESKGPSTVKPLESEAEFDELIQKKDQTVVCKFTASWCKPCHKIQPFYERLSSAYPGTVFLTIDVDEYYEISSKYNVAMMPTFVVVQGDQVLGTYAGSAEAQLQDFLREKLVK